MLKKTKAKAKKSTAKGLERPFITASFFGFNHIKTPQVEKSDLATLKQIRDPYYEQKKIQAESPFTFDVLEKIVLLRVLEREMAGTPLPIFFSYKKPIPGTFTKKPSDFVMGLEVLGLSGSTAEGILLRAAISILIDEGYKEMTVNLNSLGDKDSVAEFERMVLGFVRKHMNGFPADIRKTAKGDIFDILRSPDEKHFPVQDQAPKSMSFLSENSRNHMMEVVEYIESFELPYEITPRLIGSPAFCSHTVFEIIDNKSNSVVALGYNYGRLSKKIGMKREMPAIGVTIAFKKDTKLGKVKHNPNIKFYLIQLGFGAKIHSLRIIEVMRQAKIPVAHSISKDKMQSQISSAENLKVPYIIIVGQKESLENSVTVRDINTRVQETIPLDSLVDYLKKLK